MSRGRTKYGAPKRRRRSSLIWMRRIDAVHQCRWRFFGRNGDRVLVEVRR